MDLSEAGLGHENQLIITGEDGQGYPVSVSGMITVPVSSMYQMVANIQHLHQNGDGTVCLTPIQVSNGVSGGMGGSTVPLQKYHMLRAAAPISAIKYENGGGNSVGVEGASATGPATTEVSTGNGNGHMSSGLASLIDVIQLQMKTEAEENDCNNNGRDEEGGAGDGGRSAVGVEKSPKVRVVVQLKQK